jgi:hypothetical protein
MTDFKQLIEGSTGIPTEDTAFTSAQKLPFVVFLDKPTLDGDDFNQRNIAQHDLAVEFYAERIDAANEKKLEALFLQQGWKYSRDRTWLTDEKCFETIYQINFTERV